MGYVPVYCSDVIFTRNDQILVTGSVTPIDADHIEHFPAYDHGVKPEGCACSFGRQ
jgi:hypothetical protein